MADRKRRRSHRRKSRIRRKINAALLGIVACYFLGALFFNTHYFPNTKVGNIDISFRSLTSAKKHLEKELGSYQLKIEEPEGQETISAQDAGLAYTNLDSIRDLLKNQQALLWGYEAAFVRNHPNHALQVQIDDAKLSAAIDRLACMSPAQPQESQNAKVVYDKKNKAYVIQNETIGNIVDKPHFQQGVKEAFVNLDSSVSLKEPLYYVQPQYTATSKEVIDARDLMNAYLKAAVTYKDGDLKIRMTKTDITNFLKCSNTYKVSFKDKTIRKYVKAKLSKAFNSIDGDIPSGLTAWRVSVDQESKNIVKNIKAKKAVTRKPAYSNEGLDRDEYNLGRTFIDVNISDQHMWYVEGGKVVFSSDVVTGNVSSGHATTTGIYHIAYRQRDHLMVKYNSFVHYWMPYNTTVGVGFHDASWRSSFGGQIYRTNGSHGCINMPPAKARELFYMISAGTTVYVHY